MPGELIDPSTEWLHDNWSRRCAARTAIARQPISGLATNSTWIVYRRIREDTTEHDELWTTGRVSWPNCLYTGHFEWRVPIDDEHAQCRWFIDELPGAFFRQDVIPCWHAPVGRANRPLIDSAS